MRRLTWVSLSVVITFFLVSSSCIGYRQMGIGDDIVSNESAFAQQNLQQPINPGTPAPYSLFQSKDNETAGVCRDNQTGFTVNYNRSWYASAGRCIYFSPIFDIFSMDNILEPFVRISVTNASQPNMTLNQVQRIVMEYYDSKWPGSFQPIPRINPDVRINVGGNTAFITYFKWLKTQLAGLPYVDQDTALSFIPSISSSTPVQIPEILALLERGAGGAEIAPTPGPTAPPSNQTTPTPTPIATTPTPSPTPSPTPTPTPTPTPPNQEGLGRIIAIYTVHNGKVYVIEYASPYPKEFNRYLPTFIEMVGSFRFVN